MAEYKEQFTPPPPRKPFPWKVVIPVVLIVMLCCCCLVVVGVLVYLGTQGSGPFAQLLETVPLLENIPLRGGEGQIVGDWELYYNWDCGDTYNENPVIVSFYEDATFYAVENSSGGYGTWSLSGTTLDYIYDEDPYAHYTGEVTSGWSYYEGTMSTSDGSSGCFYAYKK